MDAQIVDVDALANVLGVTPRRVQQLAAEGVIPRSGHGEYPLLEAARAFVSHLRTATADDVGIDPRRERALLIRSQRERVDLDLARDKGQLIPAAEVERTFADMLKTVVASLETLPDVLERDAGIGPLAVARATEVINTVREELYLRLAETDEIEPSPIG